MGAFNLLDQLAFYGSYHSNKWNQLIHFIFVPTILWTIMVWLASSGSLLKPSVDVSWLESLTGMPVVLNASFLAAAAYSAFYLLLEPVAGATWALCVGLPLWLSATAFQAEVHDAWAYAIPLHIFSWYMQIHPGHAVLEKRKPALLDSLVQAFALAPLFVWFELLFFLGYRPGLYKQLQARVSQELARVRRKQA